MTKICKRCGYIKKDTVKEVFASFQSAISNQQLAKMDSDDCFITVEEFRLAKQRFRVDKR